MPAQKTFVLRTWLEAIKTTLQAQPGILFAMLYGSATETDQFRDLDIGLYVDRDQLPVSAEITYAFDVDNQRVYEIIQEDLDDLDAFRFAVVKWLNP